MGGFIGRARGETGCIKIRAFGAGGIAAPPPACSITAKQTCLCSPFRFSPWGLVLIITDAAVRFRDCVTPFPKSHLIMGGYGSIAPSGGGERSIRTGVRAVVAATAFLAVASVIAVVSLSGQEGTVRGPVRSHFQCRGGEEDLGPQTSLRPHREAAAALPFPAATISPLECDLVSYEMGRERGRERQKKRGEGCVQSWGRGGGKEVGLGGGGDVYGLCARAFDSSAPARTRRSCGARFRPPLCHVACRCIVLQPALFAP